MPRFSPEERALLAPYVTNVEGSIYCVKGPLGMIGAIFARYSRASGGYRDTFLKEFLRAGVLNPSQADALIERILLRFGDDSVGELEGTHLALEDISMLVTKEWEDRRIGGSPIEQSTRYVVYNQRDAAGQYRYVRPIDVMASPHAAKYVETMDFIFETYCYLVEPMKAYYTVLRPIESVMYILEEDGPKVRWVDLKDDSERKAFRSIYNADIRTQACDTLRALLPTATKTNVGIHGNGRYFQNALTHCYSHPLLEVQETAKLAHAELDKIMSRYVKRAEPNPYLIENRAQMQALAQRLFYGVAPKEPKNILLDRGEDHIARVLESRVPTGTDILDELQREDDTMEFSLMLYPYLSLPLTQIRDVVRHMPPATRTKICQTYLGKRETRRNRPGRALESGYPYVFDQRTDFGTYKDLERHRIMMQMRQAFTPTLGFIMPEDLVEAGFKDRVQDCVERAQELYHRLLPDLPDAAAYATLHGSEVRWVMSINDRALMHLLELRTGPQGHPMYRKLCQKMHHLVRDRSDWRAEAMCHVDHKTYDSARGDSEARSQARIAALERRGT